MSDYVIVGAGSAGCTLAARLSEDPACKVTLIEAGGSEKTMNVRGPGLYFALWRTARDWAFTTEPQEHVDGRRMFWPRGKVIGGSGSLNASLYVRGHRSDSDGWRDAGTPGWGWDDVLPLFKRSQKQRRGASAAHGAAGPLDVDDQQGLAPASLAFAEALAAVCKVPAVTCFNGGDSTGAGHYQVTVRDRVRCSTALAFLEPARARPNLTVVTGALVTGLVLDGTRVTGVRYRAGKKDEIARAEREVILCGGAIGSPHILLLSGIGPAAQLRAADVKVAHDLPGVGQNLQDHLLTTVTYDTPGGSTLALTRISLMASLLRYAVAKGGPFARSPVEAGGFVHTRAGLRAPDLQFHFVPWPTDDPNTDEKHPPPYGRRLSILPSLIYPESRGEIRLRSNDPAAAPVIEPRYFSESADLELLVTGVKLSREIAAAEPLARHCGAEVRPGPAATTDDAIRASIRRHVNTIFHPVGTCAMGTGADAVVDPELRVRGL